MTARFKNAAAAEHAAATGWMVDILTVDVKPFMFSDDMYAVSGDHVARFYASGGAKDVPLKSLWYKVRA